MTDTKFHSVTIKARDIRDGMTIRHLDGEPAVVARAGMHEDQFGWAYDLSFEGDRIPFAARGDESFERLLPIPKVGDFATLCYPSDRYPLIVVGVSPSGRKLDIVRLNYRVVSGSFQTGDEVIEYSMPKNVTDRDKLTAAFAPRRQRYTVNGQPISIGTARFYQAPEI